MTEDDAILEGIIIDIEDYFAGGDEPYGENAIALLQEIKEKLENLIDEGY